MQDGMPSAEEKKKRANVQTCFAPVEGRDKERKDRRREGRKSIKINQPRKNWAEYMINGKAMLL